MTDQLAHAFEVQDLHVRSAGKFRHLEVAAVPFDVPAWVSDDGIHPYREQFCRGGFAHIDPSRVELRLEHRDGIGDRLGIGVALVDDATYLRAEMKIFNGPNGDHLVNVLDGGGLQGVSLGFVPGDDEQITDADGPVVVRKRVKRLPEISLVSEPAYEDARVLAVRAHRNLERERQRAELVAWIAEQRGES